MSKKKTRKLTSYLREVSVVVIGVAITLYAGVIINDLKDKRDLEKQLSIISTELEDNVKSLDELISFYNRHERLREYLIESIQDPKPGTKDSIIKYEYTRGELFPFVYKRSAYEMLINSGALKLITDRNLLLNITESYTMLEIVNDDFKSYSALKMSELQKLNDLRTSIFDKTILDTEYRNLFNFYVNIQKGEYPIEVKEHILKVLSML